MNELEKVLLSYAKDQYRHDKDRFNLPDKWRPLKKDGFGDCEDFALAYWQDLKDTGFDPADLKIAICKLRDNTAHAVLIVRTDSGHYVMDCRHRFVLPYRSRILGVKRWLYAGDPLANNWNYIMPPRGRLPGPGKSSEMKFGAACPPPAGSIEFARWCEQQGA